jgi:hypothetical protein
LGLGLHHVVEYTRIFLKLYLLQALTLPA